MQYSVYSTKDAVMDYLPSLQKECINHIHGLEVNMKEGLPIAHGASLKNPGDPYIYLYWFCSIRCTIFLAIL